MSPPRRLLLLGALVFALCAFGVSAWRWWSFQYATFDLAFYVQALWQALRGDFGEVSLLGVSLLGNHAEPIMLPFLPLFALCPHPLLLPAVQVAAMATMPFSGYRIARRLGYLPWPAAVLALATLLAPASGYAALHEFHPEALAAPLFLLIQRARLGGHFRRYWLWWGLAIACKENIALVLVVWAGVNTFLERKKGREWFWRWNGRPLLAAAAWLALYGLVLSPWLNAGRVDYGNLYSRLGSSVGDMALKLFTEPQLFWGSLWKGMSQGNLLWVSLASTAGLVLLRPRWLLIATPLLLQHLLSWRASEWAIFFHYAAPVMALFWLGAAEAARRLPPLAAWLPALVCFYLQPFVGPIREIFNEWSGRERTLGNRQIVAPFVRELSADPKLSVTAGMPYLAHLAKRHELHPLHLVLKGLRTLSLRPYVPDYHPDCVLLDCGDPATFNRTASYFHPTGVIEGRPLPGSEELLVHFLARDEWTRETRNEVTLFRRGTREAVTPSPGQGKALFKHTILRRLAILPTTAAKANFAVEAEWLFVGERTNVPWLRLELTGPDGSLVQNLGMMAPEVASGLVRERREVQLPPWVPSGKYRVRGELYDAVRVMWGKDPKISPVLATMDLGEVTLTRKEAGTSEATAE